jgi:type I restriction enzyme R subunit
MTTEADTCRKYVLPMIYAAGWDDDQISEQKTFTYGRIIVVGNKGTRKKKKRADYLLKYRKDFTIAVVEAKSTYKKPGDGLQQAKEYAEILGLKFAYSTNGKSIVEHDYLTGMDTDLDSFPPPDEQRRIVVYLDELQSKVNALKCFQVKTAAELDAMLPAVLDKAFKGELK